MSSFLVLREGNNRNRWRDGQVYPDVGQRIMAPWARRPGRREREEPGLGWRKGKSPVLVGTDGKRARKKKGLVRDWSGKTMNAGGVENRI
ncbi:hypothetical protein TNCV_1775431 [Trichonephila clavipes]|nr:hypothetical protein TNCV_1775431 [Trichonephila clavipes]